ncbi:MAG TPA: hypothetical protein VGB73_20170 [Pyrinomonadaceae bacterium]
MASWGITWRGVLLGALLMVVTFVGSLGIVSFLLVKIPPTYFQESHPRDFWVERHRAVRIVGTVAKNLAGVVLVILGILMSLPLVPGQGVLTILLGVMLLDFPGKRRLEHKIVSQPRVFGSINRLRARFDKPPLVLDGKSGDEQEQEKSDE